MVTTFTPGTVPSAESKKGMVLVHGAGNFQPGYEKPLIDYICNKLGCQEVAVKPVFYSDAFKNWLMPQARHTMWTQNQEFQAFHKKFCNEAAREKLLRVAAAMPLTQVAQFALGSLQSVNMAALLSLALQPTINTSIIMNLLNPLLSKISGSSLQDLLDRINDAFKPPAAVTAPLMTPSTSSLGSGGLDLSLVVEMVYHYLYDHVIQQDIQMLVEKTLLDAVQNFDEVVLVSHSLGNLVAFDVLNNWSHGETKVTDWFTLGCPLLKSRRLRPGNPGSDHLPPGRVQRWYNVYDTNDIIADPLGPVFGRPGSYIYDVYVEVGHDPLSAHDYLNSNPTRDLIAEALA